MTALNQSRLTKQRRVTYDMRPLAASAKVYKGGLAMVLTSGAHAGYYEEANTSDAPGVIVGKWAEDADNTGGADGALSANVEFFRERVLEGLDNDTGTAVTNAMKEQACYLLDDHTATAATNTQPLGVVYEVSADGKTVWFEGRQAPPEGQQFPSIQSGTTTLITGTKTVTGVTLTATSRILLTMKDPGAGAITGLGALDAPAGSRNTGTGQFVINAIDDSKAVIGTAVCTVDWLIVG